MANTGGSARDYVFTLFIYDDEDKLALFACPQETFDAAHPDFKYACWQIERAPTTGNLHVQGFIMLRKQMGRKKVQEAFPILAEAHLEKRRGTVAEARDYCRKETTREAGPYEIGTYDQGGAGQRSDLHEFSSTVRGYAQAGLTWKATQRKLAEEYPGMYLRFSRHAQDLYNASVPDYDDGDFEPYEWQQGIIDNVEDEPDSRSIFWVYDETGGKGKSRLAAHLVAKHDGIILGGKLDDMKYAFSRDISKVAIFDLTRTQSDCIKGLVSFAESLKNGMYMNAKYESRMVTFPKCHVIFFANFMPPENVWSADRLVLIDLTRTQV